jgi:hypothetical protein
MVVALKAYQLRMAAFKWQDRISCILVSVLLEYMMIDSVVSKRYKQEVVFVG